MDFLFPLFLLAAIAVLIPILIHLFNLRKYKHVYFPNIQFLKQLQISTKRSAQLQKKLLLLSRVLFLLFLVLAFAQPYLVSKETSKTDNHAYLIYIDNSNSMSLRQGQESLLEKSKHHAINLIDQAEDHAKFFIVYNEKMLVNNSIGRKDALELIANINYSTKAIGYNQIINTIINIQEKFSNTFLEVFLFSDFQQSSFINDPKWEEEIKDVEVTIFPFQYDYAANVFIDTAYLMNENIDDSNQNELFVSIKKSGKGNFEETNLRVLIDGQTRAVKQVENPKVEEWIDTIPLQINAQWQQVTLQIQDQGLRFDDTFRLTLSPSPNLSVLVIGTANINPYLQTGLSSYERFQLEYRRVDQVSNMDWSPYSLVIFQDLNSIPLAVQEMIQQKISEGGSVLFFPGDHLQFTNINDFLGSWASIRFNSLDTFHQTVSSLYENHPIVKDLFEEIPDNILLPSVESRYSINAAISSNQQAIMSFRDGSPFLAQYNIQEGRLFLSASSLESSDFSLSYFFVPILYKMAIQSQPPHPSAVSIGSEKPFWISEEGVEERRNVWHLTGNDIEAIPMQTPKGNGVEISFKDLNLSPGFYTLKKEGVNDSLWIAVNHNTQESSLDYVSPNDLKNYFDPLPIHFLSEHVIANHGWVHPKSSFPFWKLALGFALISLMMETIIIIRRYK